MSILQRALCALVPAALAWQPAIAGGSAERTAGDVLQYAIPAAALAATWHFDDGAGRWQLIKSYGATLLGTYALKQAVNHTSWGVRPDGGDQSFPSWHTASACSGAFFVAERYGWAWGAPALAGAVYTGYTRVDLREHHVRDVVAGCALAYGFARVFVDRRLPSGMTLVPEVGSRRLALNFDWRF